MSTSSEWTILEKLLLTQAVYKYGENMWFQVARVLKQHGLIQPQQRQSDFFSQKNCQFQYYLLVESLEAEKQLYRNNDLKNDMPIVVIIARQLYLQRIEEVKAALKNDENEFGHLAMEIDSIKSGQWDQKLKETLPVPNGETQNGNNQLEGTELPITTVDETKTDEKENGFVQLPSTKGPTPTEVENKAIDHIAQQENRMKRTASESIILTTNSLKKCRLDDTKNEQVEKSNEDQVISIAISTVVDTPIVSTQALIEDSLSIETVKETTIPEKINSNTIVREEITTVPSDLPVTTTKGIPETLYPTTTDNTMTDTVHPQEKEALLTTFSVTTSSTPHVNDPAPAEIVTEIEKTDELKVADTKTQHTSVMDVATLVEPIKAASPVIEAQTIAASNPLQHQVELQPVLKHEPEHEHPIQQQHPQQEQLRLEQSYHEQSQNQQHQQQQEHIHPQQHQIPVASHQLPKIIIPEASSSSYHRSYQDQSASPISKLHIMTTPDEEDFTSSETATPTSTSAIERKKLNPNNTNDQRQKAWQKNINLLWQEIANHKNGTMFMNPIKKSYAPLYDKVVKQPLYLKTIKNRVRDGVVKTTAEFERDVVLMLTNSLMYNKEGTEMYLMAQEMLDDVREQIRLFKSADGYSVSLWENESSNNSQQ